MTIARRDFLGLAAGAACVPVMPWTTAAQEVYPARPVRILVGFAAGGSGDILARLMAQWLSDRLKQTFIIENKVGAGGNIATDTVLRSPPDGHTLLMVTMPTIVTAPLPDTFNLANEHIKAGKLRALAVTTAQRSPTLPDLPAVGEFVPGYEASVAFGICAPKGTPAGIVERLNREINAGLADATIKARLADLGATGLTLSPAAFSQYIAQDTEKWAKVVKAANVRPG